MTENGDRPERGRVDDPGPFRRGPDRTRNA